MGRGRKGAGGRASGVIETEYAGVLSPKEAKHPLAQMGGKHIEMDDRSDKFKVNPYASHYSVSIDQVDRTDDGEAFVAVRWETVPGNTRRYLEYVRLSDGKAFGDFNNETGRLERPNPGGYSWAATTLIPRLNGKNTIIEQGTREPSGRSIYWRNQRARNQP